MNFCESREVKQGGFGLGGQVSVEVGNMLHRRTRFLHLGDLDRDDWEYEEITRATR